MLPVAILCGGLATRLRPLTDQVPKSLVKVAHRPFIFHQLELLKDQGVERVVLCAGHLGEQIKALVGDGRNFGVTVDYSFDGEELLGTGGAIQRALGLLGERFFVLNGDSYLRCSYFRAQSSYESCGRLGLMTVLRNENQWDRSNVIFRNGEVIEYDKSRQRPEMAHIDFGLCVLSSAVFSSGGAVSGDLSEVFKALAARGQLAGFEVAERFYEIGSPAGLRDTESFLLRRAATA
jgi:N-acetyl-alpha-D-muramate 1-phosphate uridylyltransferase